MNIDAQHLFSDAQALTATAASTNLVDLGADRDIGMGEPMAVVITVDVAADFTTTDETYSFAIQTDDNSSFSSATIISSRAVLTTALTVGDKVVLPMPPDNERYLRVNYTLAGTTPTVTVTAFLQPMSMIDNYTLYADGFTIS